jgi:ribosome-binding factor A
MADPARARRLAKRISTIVATAIEHEIKDPGLAGVTIVDTKLSGDLHDATLYYTVMGLPVARHVVCLVQRRKDDRLHDPAGREVE